MPILGTFMATLFGYAFTFFARFFVVEKAAKLAAWTVTLAAMTALFSTATSCVVGSCAANISNMASAHQGIAMGLSIAWNQVTLTAATCYMSVWIACQIYVVKKKAINVIVGGS